MSRVLSFSGARNWHEIVTTRIADCPSTSLRVSMDACETFPNPLIYYLWPGPPPYLTNVEETELDNVLVDVPKVGHGKSRGIAK